MELRKPLIAVMAAGSIGGGEALAQSPEQINARAEACFEAAQSREDSEVSVGFVEDSTRFSVVSENVGGFIAQCVKDGRISLTVSANTLMENNKGKLTRNSSNVNLVDGEATIRNTRKYTCEGKLNDNRVRRFGASFTRSVEQLQGNETGRKDSVNYRFIVPKRINGRINGC